MDKSYFFDRNLLALSQKNPGLCSALTAAETTHNRYKFLESRNGDVIPAWVDSTGAAHPLHSIMDPKKEAKRLIDTAESGGFLILLGLGGGYYAEAALERDDIGMVLVIEYDINGLSELLCRQNYAHIFGDSRFHILADNTEAEVEAFILDMYRPVMYGGIRVIPLRARTGLDTIPYARAGNAIESAINRVSADYSVQAHFGKRWLSNILRNLRSAEEIHRALPPVRRAAVCAAGPSLTMQIKGLREKRKELFLIAADTSLPCLLYEGLTPDAVISIDCQHISYYHFMDGIPEGVFLFLDLVSPPLLSSCSGKPMFFSGGHPLTRYISRSWKALPELDTSGGNVTYAAVSLAEQLGAREIELYGADFSYPWGISYAKGTYIYPFFGKYQNRFSPLEAQASAFLYRTPLEKVIRAGGDSWYYENRALTFYRERLEEKSGRMEAVIIPVEGLGAPIKIRRRSPGSSGGTSAGAYSGNSASGAYAGASGQSGNMPRNLRIFSFGKATMDAGEFLDHYRNRIAGLPLPGKNTADYLALLKDEDQAVFTTMLPAAAALRRRLPPGDFRELLIETQKFCVNQIDRVLTQ